jgi:1,2-diacylglycerol 3-alpha-glucosyltransferase
LEAITPLIKQNTRIKLLLVGRGDSIYQKYLKEISLRNGISGNVVFHNWVPRTRLPDFYNASDIAVWPGSVSISIIEAASTGLPLIVKHSTITKNVISNGNGLTYEPDNIEKLRQRLEELLTDKDLRKAMGKKSRLLVEKKLNWKSITSQYLKAYQNLL